MQVQFYQVTRGTVEAVLPRLLERALGAGLRVALRVPDDAERARLDRHLWEYRPESFLPHSTEDGPSPAEQPVLLTRGDAAANGAAMLVALAPALPRHGFERVALVFAGEDATAAARAEWKALKADGFSPTYWSQGERGWEEKRPKA